MAILIHLGAGRCRELVDYLASPFSDILLVEPDPDLAKNLIARSAAHSNIEVRQVAIANASGESELHIYNHRDLNSLRTPTGLREPFPGLRHLRSATVTTISVKDLLQPIAFAPDQLHQIVIDTPGEEMEVVEGLIEAQVLYHFKTIVLRAGKASHYAESPPAGKILQRLQEQGYDLQGYNDYEDADRPCWTLHRNDRWQENQQLLAKLQAAAERIHHLEQQNQALSRAHEEQAKLAQERRLQIERHLQSLEEATARISQLEQQDRERELRQARMNDEMLKVEGQLDLIKELILRDTNIAESSGTAQS